MPTKFKFKNLVLVILLVFLLIPKPASAFIVGDVISFLDHLTESIEDITQPMMKVMIDFLTYYLVGILSLFISTHFLQVVINQQGEWLSRLNPMTEAGWNFTAGAANMLLVLIFLVIAFAFILKIETFQAKKTLPRLIIVALLLNFSLLFVRMMFDITQIVYNTILAAGGDKLFIDVMNVFSGGVWSIVTNILTWVGAIVVAWAIPFAHPFAQIAFTFLFGAVFLPNVVIWFFQTICFFSLSLMFGIFIFFFGARVFIISMLAMLAPLAFLSLILPQTQKWWSEWFKHLTEWLILGVFLLFFLVLGFKSIGLLAPEIGLVSKIPIPFFSWVPSQLSKFIFYYFCIFVYMAVILWLAKKYRPALAQALIDFGKEVGGLMWSRGLKPFRGALWEKMRRGAAKEEAKEALEKAEAEAKGERWKPPGGWRGVGRALTYVPVTGAVRWFQRVTPGVAVEKDIEAKMKEYEERFGTNYKDAATFPTTSPTDRAAMALYLAKTKGAKGIDALSEERQLEAIRALGSLTPRKLEDVIKHKPELIENKALYPIIQGAMLPKGAAEPDIENLRKSGVTGTDEELIKKAVYKKAADALKPPDIDNLAVKTLEHPQFQEAVVRYQTPAIIRRIGEEKGQEYINKIWQKAYELGAEEVAKTNLALLRSAVVSPAFHSVFPPIPGAEVREKIEALTRLATYPASLNYLKEERKTNLAISKLEATIKEAKGAERKMLEDRLKITREGLERLKITFKEEIGKIEESPELKRSWEELRKPKEGK